MNILVTAGGTSEKIDEVRYITNHSTGGLGYQIATCFAADETTTVTYVHGQHALTPTHPRITLVPVTSAQDLATTMTDLLTSTTFDAVIHSMAVSDYTLASVWEPTQLSQQLAERLSQLVPATWADAEALAPIIAAELTTITAHSESQAKKISSQAEQLMVALRPTPKIIQSIKQLQPQTLLVGFKLLVDVSKEELAAVARQTLAKNHADFILANDLTEVGSHHHQARLIDAAGHSQTFTTKAEIAQGIKQAVTAKLKGDHL